MFTSLFTLTGPVAPSGAGASTPLHCLRETPSSGASPGAHAAAAMPRRRGRGAMGKRLSRAGLRTEHSHPAVRSPESSGQGVSPMTMPLPQPINSSETHVLVARRSCALRCASDPISRCVVNLDATEHFYSETDVSPVAETINKNPVHPMDKEEITAPCGTGSLRRIRPQRSLRNVDDDRDLVGHDRHTDAVAPATDADHEDPITSCRDGSESAGKVRRHDRFGLPAYRHSRITWDSGIKLSSDADYTNNEALRVQNSGFVSPRPQGLSPLSSACLYLRIQSSTPWETLAKSLDSTLDSRYSISSCGRVTVMYGLRAIYDGALRSLINSGQVVSYSVRQSLMGDTTHDNRRYSESSAHVRKDMVGGPQGPIRKLDADDSAGDGGMVPCACGMVHGRGPMHHCRRHHPHIGHAVRDGLTGAAA